jgi:hypothetical protein
MSRCAADGTALSCSVSSWGPHWRSTEKSWQVGQPGAALGEELGPEPGETLGPVSRRTGRGAGFQTREALGATLGSALAELGPVLGQRSGRSWEQQPPRSSARFYWDQRWSEPGCCGKALDRGRGSHWPALGPELGWC